MKTARVKREFTFTTLSRAVTWMLVVIIWKMETFSEEDQMAEISLSVSIMLMML